MVAMIHNIGWFADDAYDGDWLSTSYWIANTELDSPPSQRRVCQ